MMGTLKVLNPDHHIATLTGDRQFENDDGRQGRQRLLHLAEANKDEDAPIGTIPIDAVFSPIKRVNYVVGNARVGQRTDYDKLTLEVWTDGSVCLLKMLSLIVPRFLKEQLKHFY
jgi:DNA-directed RNA polymerase subunit alpha